jgi:hypothetical protein
MMLGRAAMACPDPARADGEADSQAVRSRGGTTASVQRTGWNTS